MSSALENNTYSPSPFSCFAVKDPKIREIFAPDYKDRIIHHLLIDRIEKFIDKKFVLTAIPIEKTKELMRQWKD